jgi:uncharacterized protein YbjQ (UPF0145 family)
MKCPRCGSELSGGAKFCSSCGASFGSTAPSTNTGFLITTTPSVEGYRISRVLGVVTGLTPRTRGVLGKFVAGIQSLFGGEVTAFTTELEKARVEAIQRVKSKALEIGANAIVGLDLETSDLGLQQGVVVISATGTAVILEPKQP